MKLKKIMCALLASSMLLSAPVFADRRSGGDDDGSSSSSGSSESSGSSSSESSSSSVPSERSSRAECALPDLNLVRNGIERAIAQGLAAANISSRVKVKVKLANRVSKPKIPSSQVIDGLVIAVDSSGVPSITGALDLDDCSATVRVNVTIGRGSSAQRYQFDVPVTGALGSGNNGHR